MARIRLGLQKYVYLGNLDARRDWGHARDYVEMQWMMLQQDVPEDFVIATGESHSVREFVEYAAGVLGLEIQWRGDGLEEEGIVSHIDDSVPALEGLQSSIAQKNINEGQIVVRIDPRYFRPTEVDDLLGDASKAREKLGWEPKTGFLDLIAEMIRSDLKDALRDEICRQEGFTVSHRFED